MSAVPPAGRPRARGSATALGAACLLAVAWLAALLTPGRPAVGLLAVALIWTVGVLAIVAAALYLIGGPRRPVPVRRVLVLAVVVPAALVLVLTLAA